MVRRSPCFRANLSSSSSIHGEQFSVACAAIWHCTRPPSDAVEALHQSLGALQERLTPLARVLVAPVANLQRQAIGAALAQEQPQPGVHHVLRVAVHEAQRVDQRRRAAPNRLQAPKRRHRPPLVVGHRERDRRHVRVHRVHVHVLHRAPDHSQHRVRVRVDQPRQRHLAARVHALQVVMLALQVRRPAHRHNPTVHHGQRPVPDDGALRIARDHRGVCYEHVHGVWPPLHKSGAAIRSRHCRPRRTAPLVFKLRGGRPPRSHGSRAPVYPKSSPSPCCLPP